MLDEVRPTATRLLYGPLTAVDIPKSFADMLTPAPDFNPVEPWADLVLGNTPVTVKARKGLTHVSYPIGLGRTTDWVGFQLIEAEQFALAFAAKANNRVEGSMAVARIHEVELAGDEIWGGVITFAIERIHKLRPLEYE